MPKDAPSIPCLALLLVFFILMAGCAGHQGGSDETHISLREVEIRLDLADAHLRNNEPRLALQELTRIQSQAQSLPRFHFTLGYTRLLLGNGAEAAASFQKTVELAPDHAEAWNNLGLALLSSNQPGEAEQAFARALAIPTYRTPEVAALNLALLHLDRDRQDEAMRYVNLALELNWRFTNAYLLAAEIELAQGHADQAIALLKRGAEANLDDPQIMLTLAEYLLLAGRPEEALPWLERLYTTAPDSPEAATALEYQHSLKRWELFSKDQSVLHPESGIGSADRTAPAEQPLQHETLRTDQPEPSFQKPGESAYIVQIGGFMDKNMATKLRDTFKAKDYPAEITEILHKNKTWHLVFIASTQNRNMAEEIAARFTKQEGAQAVVVKVGQGRYLEMTPP